MDTKRDMPPGNDPGKPQNIRYVYGPRALGALMPGVMRAAFRKRAAATAQLIADWEAIIGPRLAAETIPRRLAAGTLTLGCAGPLALELQHLAPALIARINGQLGREVVQRLKFVHETRQPPVRPSVPSAVDTSAVEHAIASVPDGPLREALRSLGQAVMARRP